LAEKESTRAGSRVERLFETYGVDDGIRWLLFLPRYCNFPLKKARSLLKLNLFLEAKRRGVARKRDNISTATISASQPSFVTMEPAHLRTPTKKKVSCPAKWKFGAFSARTLAQI